MAHAPSIAKPLQGLRSTSVKEFKCRAHQRGVEAEERVLRHYLDKNHVFLGQRLRTPFAEVDLLFRTPEGHVLMVEVKAISSADFQIYRISQRQKQRLLRALIYFSAQWDCLVEIHWAFVEKSGKVQIIEDISG